MVLGHLRVILNKRYGSGTDAWFTQQAIDSSKGYYFCTTTGQVIHDDDGEEDDLFAGFCSNISPALAANARAKGEIIEEEYDGNLDDIDVYGAEEPPIKLDMHIMFNNSALGEGGGYNDARHNDDRNFESHGSPGSNWRSPNGYRGQAKHNDILRHPHRYNNKYSSHRCLHATDWST
jgi:hypothetical protein